MENRFYSLRRTKAPKKNGDICPVETLANILIDKNFIFSKSQNVAKLIREIEAVKYSVNGLEKKSINVDLLIAYSRYFNVTTDYLLGIRDNAIIDENIAMIGKATGLSDESIENIKELKTDEKFILDKMIKNYCLLDLLSEIKGKIAVQGLKPHIRVVLDEKFYVNGNEYDQFLQDALTDVDALSFFDNRIVSKIVGAVNSTIADKELQEHFAEIFKNSKTSSRISTEDALTIAQKLVEKSTVDKNP